MNFRCVWRNDTARSFCSVSYPGLFDSLTNVKISSVNHRIFKHTDVVTRCAYFCGTCKFFSMRAVKTSVERGFTSTAVGLGSSQLREGHWCSARAGFALHLEKGDGVNIIQPGRGTRTVTWRSSALQVDASGKRRLFFFFSQSFNFH